jgi:hypothetical protein
MNIPSQFLLRHLETSSSQYPSAPTLGSSNLASDNSHFRVFIIHFYILSIVAKFQKVHYLRLKSLSW